MKSTSQRVKTEIAKKLEINIEVIDERASLEDLGADELDQLEILMKLENEFEIDIDDDEFFKCQTVGDIISLLDQTVNKHGSNN